VNSTFQLDLHPDADSLNAFAEQALGVPERERILAHLAQCSRCRQVIFLAQQAAAEAESPALLPVARPATSYPWYKSWSFAWIPAAAVAASLALAVTLHSRHASPAPEMAVNVPQSELAAPQPVLQEQPHMIATHRAVPPPAANSTAGYARSAENRELASSRKPSVEISPAAAPSAEPPSLSGTIAPSAGESREASVPAVNAVPAPLPLQAVETFKSEPAVTAWQQKQRQMSNTLSSNANTSQISRESTFKRKDAARVSRGGSAYAAAPRMTTKSSYTNTFDAVSAQPRAKAPALRATGNLKLPSGLAAVSTATAPHLILEIDLAGALFLSSDSGLHWQQVASQWTGRATEVRVQEGSTASAGEFELKNDSGSIWVSADGKSWTAK